MHWDEKEEKSNNTQINKLQYVLMTWELRFELVLLVCYYYYYYY